MIQDVCNSLKYFSDLNQYHYVFFNKGLAIRIHNDRPDGRKRTIIQDEARYGVLEDNLTRVTKPLPTSLLTGTDDSDNVYLYRLQ
jgi:hypothetical protein